MRNLLALSNWQGWGVGEWAIALVIVAALVAVVCVALRKFEITVPDWLVKILSICLVALVVVVAIRFLISL